MQGWVSIRVSFSCPIKTTVIQKQRITENKIVSFDKYFIPLSSKLSTEFSIFEDDDNIVEDEGTIIHTAMALGNQVSLCYKHIKTLHDHMGTIRKLRSTSQFFFGTKKKNMI